MDRREEANKELAGTAKLSCHPSAKQKQTLQSLEFVRLQSESRPYHLRRCHLSNLSLDAFILNKGIKIFPVITALLSNEKGVKRRAQFLTQNYSIKKKICKIGI